MENKHEKPNKTVTILVNTQEKEVPKEKITYDTVVRLAFSAIENDPKIGYQVLYFRGNADKPKGQLIAGDSIMVTDGMVFNVTKTTQS